ncbi:MAG: alpha/beta hydrolase [Planctomycetes bacterium]|nr:alpha/beta hydrolase [Planctomycetota bacterium]
MVAATVAVAAFLLLAACAAPPPVPLADGVTTLAVTPSLLPPEDDGFVPPMVRDPSGTMVGWLDLRYAASERVAPAEQSLDLIAPAAVERERGAAERGRPIVVFVHGGGWQRGEKRGFLERRAPAFTSAGFLLATINYRLAPAATHPAQIRDTAAALAWLREHAKQFGGDPEALFVMGHSAGAHLAALVSVDPRWLGEHDLPLTALRGALLLDGASYDVAARAGDVEGADEHIAAVFGSDPAVWADASPLSHVAAARGTPPCLLIVAGKNPDSGEDAALLSAKLREAGGRADVVTFPDKTHVAISRELGLPGDGPTATILDFVAEVSGRARPPPPAEAAPR